MGTARLLVMAGVAVGIWTIPAAAIGMDGVKAAYQRADYGAALRQLLPLAAAGDPEAQYIAGYMYGHGQGTAADPAKSLAWYRTAAEQGYGEAEFAVALIYEDGKGVPQSYGDAAEWYAKAAEQGLPRAQNNLGNLYNNGFGVTQDYTIAHMWYELSSKGGDERAGRNLTLVEQVMPPAEIAAAKRLARDWTATHPRKLAQP